MYKARKYLTFSSFFIVKESQWELLRMSLLYENKNTSFQHLMRKRYREVTAPTRDRQPRRRVSLPMRALKLPLGLRVTTIQMWIPLYTNMHRIHKIPEVLDLLKRIACVNQEWRCAAESPPIIGRIKCCMEDTSLPHLIGSKLHVRHLVLDKKYSPNVTGPAFQLYNQELEASTLRAVSGMVALEDLTLRGYTCLNLDLLRGLENLVSISFEYYGYLTPGFLQPLANMSSLTAIALEGFNANHIDCNVFQ